MNVDQLRQDLQQGSTPHLRHRRVTLGLSLAGIASMTPATLLQMGVLKHLPDPPLKSFNSDKVNSSYDAYRFGVPDGTLGILSFAANLPLLAFGGANRAQDKPWVPLVATGKAAVDATVALWYFYQMPTKERAWCIYCIAGQLASLGILASTLPEARAALASLRGK
ncbi:MAG: vitamin K epoxide reductase family protein [Chloroflexota bacterium]|nr:vitamin K epoxide reductase family protein [Chloroflexota bacterium]